MTFSHTKYKDNNILSGIQKKRVTIIEKIS